MVTTLLIALLCIICALLIGLFFMGLFRKITARSQWRYGPPLLQPFIDIIRMFSQDGFSHGFIFD
ncbi:NADH-quinone oxidoreductase subunit H, partial [bacterium]|nr:NADH-quinone oxidoreductase subunit H [bacterium]